MAHDDQTRFNFRTSHTGDTRTTVVDASLYDSETTAAGVKLEIYQGATLLDTYRVESDPMAGGYGKVWRVHHKGWNVELAMKQPRAEKFRNAAQKEAFISECDKWISLGLHPHIVSCYYVREMAGIPTIFAEWMAGGTLLEWLEGPLYAGDEADVQRRVLDITIQFARGLRYAHEHMLVHRDVKPENLLLTPSGGVKVSDFGIAGAVEDASVSKAYTPAYCSPEQAAGEVLPLLAHRTDIYSWALTVLEMFLGERRWKHGPVVSSAPEQYFAMKTRVNLPPALEELLRVCLQRRPEQRGLCTIEREEQWPEDFDAIEAQLLAIYQDVTGRAYPREKPKAASDTADSLNNRALSFLDIGKPAAAEACWSLAAQIENDHLETAYNYGLHLWRTAQINDLEAQFMLQRAGGQNACQGQYFAGMLHWERDDLPGALKCFQEAAKLSPRAAEVQTALQSLSEVKIAEPLLAEFGEEPGGVVRRDILSPDGRKVLAYNFYQRGPRLYDIATGKMLCEYPDQGMLQKACFHEDGKKILFMGRHKVTSGDTHKGRIMKTYALAEYGNAPPVAASADFNTIVFQHMYDIVALNPNTGKRKGFFADRRKVSLLLLSPDGRRFIEVSNYINTQYPETSHYDILLWGIATEQKIRTFVGHTAIIRQAKASRDFKLLLAADDNVVKLWDIETGACRRVFEVKASDVAFHPRKRQMLATTATAICLFDLDTGRCLRSMPFEHPSVVNITPDGQSIISTTVHGSVGPKGTRTIIHLRMPAPAFKADWRLCRVTDVNERTAEVLEFEGHLARAAELLAAKDISGALAALEQARAVPGYANVAESLALQQKIVKYCRITGLKTYRLERTFGGRPLDMSIDGRYGLFYVADSERTNSLQHSVADLDIDTGEALAGLFNQISDAAMELNVNARNVVDLIDLDTGQVLYRHGGNPGDMVASHTFMFTPDGYIAKYSWSDWQYLTDAEMPALPMGPSYSHHYRKMFYSREVGRNTFHPNGRKVAFLQVTETQRYVYKNEVIIKVVPSADEADKSRPLQTLAQYQLDFERDQHAIHFSPDGCYLLGGSWGASDNLKLFDAATGRCLRTYNFAQERGVDTNGLAFSPDGRFFVLGLETILVYAVDCSEPVREFGPPSKHKYTVAFSPDGQVVAASDGEKLSFWRVATGECLLLWQDDYSKTNTLRFSNDGRRLLIDQGLFTLEWDYAFPGWAVWDEGVAPYIENFMALNPDYSDAAFDLLMAELQARGFGYVRPEGVRAKIDELQFGW